MSGLGVSGLGDVRVREGHVMSELSSFYRRLVLLWVLWSVVYKW